MFCCGDLHYTGFFAYVQPFFMNKKINVERYPNIYYRTQLKEKNGKTSVLPFFYVLY